MCAYWDSRDPHGSLTSQSNYRITEPEGNDDKEDQKEKEEEEKKPQPPAPQPEPGKPEPPAPVKPASEYILLSPIAIWRAMS